MTANNDYLARALQCLLLAFAAAAALARPRTRRPPPEQARIPAPLLPMRR
jgi:hypothetical protein